MKVEHIGDRLISKGVISPEQLEFALKEQKRTDERLGTILRQLNLITPATIKRVFSIMEPLLYVCLALVVLTVALAIYMPLYQMMASFSRK